MLAKMYRECLFAHNYLVGESTNYYRTPLYFDYALAAMFGIRVVEGEFLVNRRCIEDASDFIGENVPNAFYYGFPNSVFTLTPETLLVDQLISYIDTYGLDNWKESQHSIFEENIRRVAFHERTETKSFKCVDENTAIKLIGNYVEYLLDSTRPLNGDMYNLVLSYIKDYNYVVKNIKSKNTAIKLLIDTKDTYYSKFIELSDVLKVVEIIQYNDDIAHYIHGVNRHSLKKLNLKNQDRKFVSNLINLTCKGDEVDVFERRQDWGGLLHHLHFKPTTESAQIFANSIRDKSGKSVFSLTEDLIKEGIPNMAAALLKVAKGSGAVLRNLDYYISRCTSEEQMDSVIQNAISNNPIINLQLYIKYSQYNTNKEPRIFRFTKNNLTTVHIETNEETEKRKSLLTEEQVKTLKSIIYNNLKSIYRNTLGKVYIDESFKTMALPLNQSTGNFDFGTMTTGSIIDIPNGKKIRCFTYWEKTNDIDLSCIGLKELGDTVEFSWRTMYNRQSAAVCFSGDQTSGYNGGSEYFDVDIDKVRKQYPDMRYIIFNNNVFSGSTFSSCICRAGYMMRDEIDSGEVFEPKTVKTSYTINCDSSMAYLFAIDIINRKIIWLNQSLNSMERIGSNSPYKYLTKFFDITKIINVYDLFKMKAREIISNPEDADIIVSDGNYKLKQDQILITSRDQESIMKYMDSTNTL